MERTKPSRKPGTRPQPNKALLEARIRKGLSREALAYQSGVSRKQVGLIESGVAYPREENAVEIANALGVDVFDLFPLDRHPVLSRRAS